jgi:TonB-linked SusC/RagA family outer membrane protein
MEVIIRSGRSALLSNIFFVGFLKTCIAIFLLLALCFNAMSQGSRITITGSVTDSAGNIIRGANVTADNKKNVGTSTDANGKFVLDVEPGTVLVFSYISYKEKRVTVNADTKVLNVILELAAASSDEVVVVAYSQKQRKEALVGSVTTVRPENLKIPSSNITNALAGQVAGVIAFQRSGQPGQDNASFFIRGVTTFGYNSGPLILIDNVELSASDLARLQIDDIASFSFLKDASATALYGARGANGVILVSTKEGKVGRAKINVRVEQSSSQSTKTLELADPITYMKLYNEATITRDPLIPPPFSQDKIINTQATLDKAPGSNQYVYPAVDWLSMLFKKRTSTQRANLSLSGGGGVARYYVAGSYNVDHGIIKEDSRNNNNNNIKFQNYQLRSNINIDVTKSTELIVRLAANFSDYNGPLATDGGFSTDMYDFAVHTSPVLFPAFFPADSANLNTKHILFGNVAGQGANSLLYYNPYALLMRGHKNSSESRMSAQLEINQKLNFITNGLSFRGMFSTNRYSFFQSQMGYSPFYYTIGSYDKPTGRYTLSWLNSQPTGNNVATEYLNYYPGGTNLNTFIYFMGALDYGHKFGDHNINGTLIATGQQTRYSNASDLQSSLPYRNQTLAGRATYGYRDRYFAEFNFGYNGSERFSKNHRYGFFPTIGAGWVLSNEKFWSGLSSVLTRAKIRGSYGLAGNDAISSRRFFYLSDVNLNGGGNYASFGSNGGYGRSGVFINNYENTDVTWETARQVNLALELTVFKNLNIVAEVYKKHTYNILQNRTSIPTTSGLEAAISANLGAVDAKGLDLHMDYKQNFTKDFWISALGNFTFAQNKYVKYEEPQWLESYRYLKGQPVYRNFGYIAERLFVDDIEARNSPPQIFSTNGRPPKGGDIKYRDLNGDGKIDGADQTFIGFPQVPEILYGFGLSAGYKGFDITAFFQGQTRVTFFINPNTTSPFIPSPNSSIAGNTQLLSDYANNHWSEENQNLYALYPRLGVNRADLENNLQSSTWWMRDGSFMRLKSLDIGYTLPTRILKKAKLSNCRIYFNGLNLLTWSPFKMWDPELGGNGFNYPIQKVFNVGINVNL